MQGSTTSACGPKVPLFCSGFLTAPGPTITNTTPASLHSTECANRSLNTPTATHGRACRSDPGARHGFGTGAGHNLLPAWQAADAGITAPTAGRHDFRRLHGRPDLQRPAPDPGFYFRQPTPATGSVHSGHRH